MSTNTLAAKHALAVQDTLNEEHHAAFISDVEHTIAWDRIIASNDGQGEALTVITLEARDYRIGRVYVVRYSDTNDTISAAFRCEEIARTWADLMEYELNASVAGESSLPDGWFTNYAKSRQLIDAA